MLILQKSSSKFSAVKQDRYSSVGLFPTTFQMCVEPVANAEGSKQSTFSSSSETDMDKVAFQPDHYLGLSPDNDYKLVKYLGAGKIGMVYRAESDRTGLVLACKVI